MRRYSRQHINRLVSRAARDQMLAREPDHEMNPNLGLELEQDLNMEYVDEQSANEIDYASEPEISDLSNSSGSDSGGEQEVNDLDPEEENDLNHGLQNNDHVETTRENINTKLQSWAVKFGVRHNALTAIMKSLNKHPCFDTLPTDCRSLLKTPRHTEIKRIEPGDYIHFGIIKGLSKIVREFGIQNAVVVDISIDGVPISKNTQWWPIQCRVTVAKEAGPFIIGIWQGPEKPTDFNEFLSDFVNDAEQLIEHGLVVDGNRLDFIINSFIADAPARSSLAGIIGHTGYYSCPKCVERGSNYNGQVVASTKIGELRKDEDFHENSGEEKYTHHISGNTILHRLGVDLVTRIPLDYQHLVCSGVMKKMMVLQIRGMTQKLKPNEDGRRRRRRPNPARLSVQQQNELSFQLTKLKKWIPIEFARVPRKLKDIDRWKSTEFRQFLLYTGPVVLKPVLTTEYYEHFMLFHAAISILASKDNYKKYNEYAGELLSRFVRQFTKLYGRENVVYNVHGLLHLHKDALLFGPLDDFSTFPFENNLQKIIHIPKAYTNPLQQISNRLHEQSQIPSKRRAEFKVQPRMPYVGGPILNNYGLDEFKTLKLFDFTIRIHRKDNIIGLNCGSIVIVENILRNDVDILLIGRKFTKIGNFYKFPHDSEEFGIVRVWHEFVGEQQSWSLKKVRRKYVCIPYKRTSYVLFPLLHC